MTKDELKSLSTTTFKNNDNGEITPALHRSFNNQLIDSIPIPGTWTNLTISSSSGIRITIAKVMDFGMFYALWLNVDFLTNFEKPYIIVSNFDFGKTEIGIGLLEFDQKTYMGVSAFGNPLFLIDKFMMRLIPGMDTL